MEIAHMKSFIIFRFKSMCEVHKGFRMDSFLVKKNDFLTKSDSNVSLFYLIIDLCQEFGST